MFNIRKHKFVVAVAFSAIILLVAWLLSFNRKQKTTSQDELSDSNLDQQAKIITNTRHSDGKLTSVFKRSRHYPRTKSISIEEKFSLPEIVLNSNATVLPQDILAYATALIDDSSSHDSLMNKLTNQDTREELLESLIYLMRGGNTKEKCAALLVIGSIWENLANPPIPIDNDEKETSIPNGLNQIETQHISRIFLAGLTSQDEDVRMQAAISLNELSDEISNPLCLFALSQEDVDMKIEVLKPHASSDRHEDITLFFHALDDDDATISGYAKENLNYVLGVTFETSNEAFEWWEQHHMP